MVPTLMLVKAWVGEQKMPTFKLIPIDRASPYVGGIYNPVNNFLLMYSKEKESNFIMVERLDDNGQTQYIKGSQQPKGERRSVEEWYKVSIEDLTDIDDFIKMMCVNADSFEYHQYLAKIEIGAKMETPSLILQP